MVFGVWGLDFSPDGGQLAIGGTGPYAAVWDTRTGKELFTLPGLTGTVFAMKYTSDGKRLVTEGYDLPRIWDLASRQVLLILPGHTPAR